VAYEEQLPIGLVQDMVLEVEEAGDICRDESEGKLDAFSTVTSGQGQEVHWWVNIFDGYIWDGQAD
jgi:ESCRT-II complex subunit VPS36